MTADVMDRVAPEHEISVVADAIQLGARPHEIVGLLSLIAIYVLVQAADDRTAIDFANICGPLLFSALLTFGAYVTFRDNPLAIMTPLFWFRVATGVFFGIGSISLFIVADDAVSSLLAFYQLTAIELLKINLLNAVGTLTVLVAARVIGSSIAAIFDRSNQPQSPLPDVSLPIPITTCAKWFLTVGLAVRYGYVLPSYFGQLDGSTIGAIVQLDKLANVGLLLAFVLAFRGDRRWRLVAWSILGIDLVVSIATFSKSVFLLQVLMPVLAYIYVRRHVRALLIGAAIVFSVYLAIKPVIDYSRLQPKERSLTERLSIVGGYLAGGGEKKAFSPSQAWLMRLTYAPAQGLAVNLYDRGITGSTVENIGYMFIPRFLWRDKPVMTLMGGQFNYIGSGSDASFSAPGWFAEAYWNGGWLYVLLWMSYAGAVFVVLSMYSLYYTYWEKFLFLPIILTGITMGYFPDGWFASTLIGGIIILVFLHWVLLAFSRGWSMLHVHPLRAKEL